MKQKLIKLSETHYIVVDDSEIKEIPCCNIAHKVVVVPTDVEWARSNMDNLKVITHSTEPLEANNLYYININPLSLSEVEEAINGYNVEEVAENSLNKQSWDTSKSLPFNAGYIKGYIEAHQQLVKDKLFTVEDIRMAFNAGDNYRYYQNNGSRNIPSDVLDGDDYIQSLHQKTEWDIEFVGGKIKLIK